MCIFITVAVRERHTALLPAIVGEKFVVRTQTNRSVSRHFGERRTVVLTSGGCSCDLYARVRDDEERVAENEVDAARTKYRKRGWSEAKVRWALAARHTRIDRGPGFGGLRSDVRDVIARLAEVGGEVGLLVHDYSAGIDEETVTATRGSTLSPEDLRKGLGRSLRTLFSRFDLSVGRSTSIGKCEWASLDIVPRVAGGLRQAGHLHRAVHRRRRAHLERIREVARA